MQLVRGVIDRGGDIKGLFLHVSFFSCLLRFLSGPRLSALGIGRFFLFFDGDRRPVDLIVGDVVIAEHIRYRVCGVHGDWTMADFKRRSVDELRRHVGDGRVLLAVLE